SATLNQGGGPNRTAPAGAVPPGATNVQPGGRRGQRPNQENQGQPPQAGGPGASGQPQPGQPQPQGNSPQQHQPPAETNYR
ncbi:MAG TPA: hypothetical protein PK988_06855, partial [Candidatus Sumerlaeota bacterium]|nr:hypothetical protein [Candidatus Sumerlaeota bacterium]